MRRGGMIQHATFRAAAAPKHEQCVTHWAPMRKFSYFASGTFIKYPIQGKSGIRSPVSETWGIASFHHKLLLTLRKHWNVLYPNP